MQPFSRSVILVVLVGVCVFWNWTGRPLPAENPKSLEVLQGNYPAAFFFRSAEGMASNPRMTYERWNASFSRLMGIEGKVLDEEVPGRSIRNIEFFTWFKKEHPAQLVLLHYNGNARDPRFETEDFFAGHFIYYNGATILDDVPAEEGETEIHVDNATLFRLNMGRYQRSNDDVGLCLLTGDGRPDWHQSEQVQLISIDAKNKTIRVKRGCYGTQPRAFPAEKAYAAAHVTEGPWGGQSNILWYYNYSTRCPRDRQGRTCLEVHAEDVAARFLPGGELEAFDGLEFDVLHHEMGGRSTAFGPDCDGDGQADGGVFDGVNTYGHGVVEFCRQLRDRLGPDRLILADGMSERNQRAFEILNGIESEGWPTLSDWAIHDWSGGLNRHWFWAENGAPPAFNYINHKFTTAGPTPGSRVQPEVPFSVHRLVFAAGVFTDSAICYATAPRSEPGELLGIWDELDKGSEDELGWLGHPVGPAVRLAAGERDLLEGRAAPINREILKRFSGDGATFILKNDALQVASDDEQADSLRFRLNDVPTDGLDLFVSVSADGQPQRPGPPKIARQMWVGVAPPPGQLTLPDMPAAGICLRGSPETEITAEHLGSIQWANAIDLGGAVHDGYRVHPPYRGGVGYTFWQRDVDVPQGGRLELFTGMGEKSPQRSDGVWFRVLVADAAASDPGEYRQIFEHSQKSFEWVPHTVSLADWAGRRVRLKFVADCGPHDNSTTDHAHWGDVAVLGPEGRRSWTAPDRYMTWVNPRPFTSGFYFREIRSKTVNLEFSIEGSEPIRIRSVTAHAHPDAIYREFQKGLVLANPSPRPYNFDLADLLPGRKFRRLKGSSQQDVDTNDGSPVEGRLTLGPLEGLFLVKDKP
jgi:hypothetical protein